MHMQMIRRREKTRARGEGRNMRPARNGVLAMSVKGADRCYSGDGCQNIAQGQRQQRRMIGYCSEATAIASDNHGILPTKGGEYFIRRRTRIHQIASDLSVCLFVIKRSMDNDAILNRIRASR
jgi:hypothetical protein